MQIRQLDALQNMAKSSGSKVVFGESIHLPLFMLVNLTNLLELCSADEPEQHGWREHGGLFKHDAGTDSSFRYSGRAVPR